MHGDQEDTSSQTEKQAQPIKALLIDDDYEFFETIGALARKYPYLHLEYAPDGFTAFKMVRQKNFDVIVSDINMPFMNGLALVSEFQKKNLEIPFVLISAEVNDQVSRDAFRVGAFNILQKPFTMEELIKKLQLAIEINHFQDVERLEPQEKAYIYNTIKSFYFDADKVLAKIRKHNIPIAVVTAELEKKTQTGKCIFDDLSSLKYFKQVA